MTIVRFAMMFPSADSNTRSLRLREAAFAVVDVETTGVDASVDRVVEVACAVVRADEQIDTFRSFVDPGRAIPSRASAVHQITDADVRNAPRLEALQPKLQELCANAIVVAHNASFDLRFLPFLRHRPVLCTMRLAMRVLPDAPNYRNQGLRRYLDLADNVLGDSMPHRALGDVRVTSGILTICLRRYVAAGGVDNVDVLVREIAAPRALATLPFGRYRGVAIHAVPTDYLQWVERESRSASVDARYTAQRELKRRDRPAHDRTL